MNSLDDGVFLSFQMEGISVKLAIGSFNQKSKLQTDFLIRFNGAKLASFAGNI